MFDTMTLTKATGAVCGSLLVFLLGSWAAEAIYSVGGGHDEQAQGYVVDTGEDDAPEEAEETGPDLPELLASADASKGERVFNQCSACHKVEDGANGVGPHLYGVVARDVGSVDGFDYSGALSEAADVWSAQELYAFLENPAEYAPGTSMGYSGLSKPEDRVNVIAYLDQTDGEENIELAAAEADGGDGSGDDGREEEGGENGSDEGSDGDASDEGSEGEASDEGSEEAAEDGADEGSEEAAEEGSDESTRDASDEGSDENGSTDEASDEGSGDASGDATADDASEFETLVASADVDSGQRIYRQCQACHQVEEERNGVGPHLVGIVGRDIASVDGFNYSDALAGLDGDWTLDELSAWIENPSDYAEGNKMGYQGLKDEQDRADLMAYLQSVED